MKDWGDGPMGHVAPMNKSHYILLGAVVAALVIGAAYGDRIPVISTIYPKLPGSRA